MPIGPSIPFNLLVIFWIVRIVVISFICTFLGWLGIRVLDALTPKIHQREKIGENPISVGLFIGGFTIFIGLIIHGACTAPMAIGTSLTKSLINFRRLGLITISFFVSLLIGIALFNILDKLTPKIPFLNIKDNSIAVGIYVLSYLLFLGIILHSALTMSL
ncbi:hypothetical protein KAV79_07055 [Candidatus Aerophobetes bacterium]|nr:hypothetical protein [Candidatus Aerophobetes bacterium]